MASDGFAKNDRVRLHYLDSGGAVSVGLPMVLVPGLRGSAEDFLPTMAGLAPRRSIALSLRGRGRSETPDLGYSFDDHVDDIAALVGEAHLIRFSLMAHSIGVAYAIGYAHRFPHRVAGLILAGYPAHYPKLTADWALRVIEQYPGEMRVQALLGVQDDSSDLPLWDRLSELTCPILVLRGGKSTSRLKEAAAEQYAEAVPHARIVTFPDSGHRLWRPDFDRYLTTIQTFLDDVDRSAAE